MELFSEWTNQHKRIRKLREKPTMFFDELYSDSV